MTRSLLRLLCLVLSGCQGGSTHPRSEAPHGHQDGHRHGGHGHGHGHPEGHGHPHGDGSARLTRHGVGLQVTRWTDRVELYGEYAPPVSGVAWEFVAHLTLLEGFEALEDASVTLHLRAKSGVHMAELRRVRPGVFRGGLVAPQAGAYAGRLAVVGPGVHEALTGFEVEVHPNAHAAQHAEPSPEQADKTTEFLKEQQWRVPFGTALAVRGQVMPSLEVVGEVVTPPGGQAEVGAGIAGRVVAPSAGLPRPGQSVRKGESLASIAPAPSAPEEGARASLRVAEAEARMQAAKAAWTRAQRLIKERAIPQRQVDEARRELRVARQALVAARRARALFTGAGFTGAGASGRGGMYRVIAPIAGVVVEVRASIGKSVVSGEPLFRIVQLDELWLKARVSEYDAPRLHAERDASFKVPGLEEWMPLRLGGEQPTAALVSVGRTVDPRSRTVDVIYALREPDERLRVGALVRLALPMGPIWQGVVVPRTAVLENDGRPLLYVQRSGEQFEERALRLGPRAGGRIGIEQGLTVGERVVTRGASIIRLKSRTSSAPSHGHVH